MYAIFLTSKFGSCILSTSNSKGAIDSQTVCGVFSVCPSFPLSYSLIQGKTEQRLRQNRKKRRDTAAAQE